MTLAEHIIAIESAYDSIQALQARSLRSLSHTTHPEGDTLQTALEALAGVLSRYAPQ